MLAERLEPVGLEVPSLLVEASGDCALGSEARREDLRGRRGESVVLAAFALPLEDEDAEADWDVVETARLRLVALLRMVEPGLVAALGGWEVDEMLDAVLSSASRESAVVEAKLRPVERRDRLIC